MFGFLLSPYKQPELVNKLFERLDDGTFRVQKDTNSFHQWRKIYEGQKGKYARRSYHFHGDKMAMDASL